MIRITPHLSIPEDALTFKTSRSSGPGGQNVNKVSSRVTLQFDVANSPCLTPAQKRLICGRLDTRINKAGILQVASQKHRSQAANRQAALERFGELLREALRRAPPRKKTRVSQAAKERRLAEKKRRGRLKQERSENPLLGD